MKIYITSINRDINIEAWTSLKAACAELEVSYYSAAKGKRVWYIRNPSQLLEIKEINVNKVIGRGNKNFGK